MLKRERDSRFERWLLWVLRHESSRETVSVDAQGWASLEDIVAAMPPFDNSWLTPTKSDVRRQVEAMPPGRLELSNDRIRACYGHSMPGVDTAIRAMPPPKLFHGTSESLLPEIHNRGLLPMTRNRVHLTSDLDYARLMAQRIRPGVILSIDAVGAIQTGTRFYRTGLHIWQTDAVVPEFLTVEERYSLESQD